MEEPQKSQESHETDVSENVHDSIDVDEAIDVHEANEADDEQDVRETTMTDDDATQVNDMDVYEDKLEELDDLSEGDEVYMVDE